MSGELAANIEAVRQRISAAAQRVGRQAGEITLVAVTKTQPLETVVAAFQAGLRHFGENRAHEYLDKVNGFAGWWKSQPAAQPICWHFIGHLQSRQVGLVLAGRPSLIHSVDSLKLAERINRLAKREECPPLDILLQCNISGEQTKSGFALERWSTNKNQWAAFLAAVRQLAAFDRVVVRGLMTMAPFSTDPEMARPTFQSLVALQTRLQAEAPQLDWRHLSMGMTDDFEVAIEEGATLIRVGRAIFGERNYT
jgi:pyridoxal phosphate enzyme (YggS family)